MTHVFLIAKIAKQAKKTRRKILFVGVHVQNKSSDIIFECFLLGITQEP